MEALMNGLTLEETRYAVKVSRLEKGWSQQKLADKVGISRSLLAKFENGNRKLSDEKIEQLVNCLLSEEKNEHLEGIVDYLTIHFFSTDYEMLIDKVLNISMNHMVFHETKILGYNGRYSLLKAIDIRISGDEKKGEKRRRLR